MRSVTDKYRPIVLLLALHDVRQFGPEVDHLAGRIVDHAWLSCRRREVRGTALRPGMSST